MAGTGFDRLMAILCGTKTIRDVIAFPKTGAGTDTFFRSPSGVSDEVLAQYGIRSLRPEDRFAATQWWGKG